MSAALNRDRLVNDVSNDLCRRRQADLDPANGAFDPSIDDDIVRNHLTDDFRALANRQDMSPDVTFDRSFDLNIPGCPEIALQENIGRQN